MASLLGDGSRRDGEELAAGAELLVVGGHGKPVVNHQSNDHGSTGGALLCSLTR